MKPGDDLVERIKSLVKHCAGAMTAVLVIDPEDEAKAAAIFKKLGSRAGRVTYRVEANRKTLLNAQRMMPESEWKKRLEETRRKTVVPDADIEAAQAGDMAAAVTRAVKPGERRILRGS